MIRSHHITAELARQHQRDLIVAGRAARAGSATHGSVESVDGARPERDGGVILRHLRVRRHDAAPGSCDGQAQPAGRAA